MKAVLLNDTDGRVNIGCRLTSSTLKKQIVASFAERTNDFLLEPYAWRFGKGVDRVGIWRNAKQWIETDGVTDRSRLFVSWLNDLAVAEYGSEAVRSTLNADLVIFHPEGSISDWNSKPHILSLICLPLLAAIKGRPVLVINGTFPLFQDDRFDLLNTFFGICWRVLLRDRMSSEHYAVGFMPDTAITWMHAEEPKERQDPSHGYILISTAAQHDKEANVLLAQEALSLCRELGLKPLVMTKRHGDLDELSKEISNLNGLCVSHATLEEASDWLQLCRLHVGGRYHMALFCLVFGVPSVLVPANTHKNFWLSEEFDGVEICTSFDQIGYVAHEVLRQSAVSQSWVHRSVSSAQALVRCEMEKTVAAWMQVSAGPERTVESTSIERIAAAFSFADLKAIRNTGSTKTRAHRIVRVFLSGAKKLRRIILKLQAMIKPSSAIK